MPFWSERLSEHTFGFEEEELRPYFALDNVLDGLFGLCTRLFGVTIERSDGEAEVWHPDVGFFKVLDEASGEHLASFFLDPYARPENKRGGAWMGTCVGKSKVLERKPVAYLTCNGSPPVDGKPSLMTFSEVTTLFHETGHGLQHMLTKVPHAPAAGISGVEWDAVELPSQFMENWCYDEATVYGGGGADSAGLAKHYETGEPLPKELFAKLCEQKTFQAGMGMTRQLYFGALDMALHHSFDPKDEATSVFDLQKQISSRFSVIEPLEDDRFLCGFGHIFAGGYAAGYYCVCRGLEPRTSGLGCCPTALLPALLPIAASSSLTERSGDRDPPPQRTSGPRSSVPTPSPPLRMRASTTRRRCARWAASSARPCWPSEAAPRRQRSSRTSAAASRSPRPSFAIRV